MKWYLKVVKDNYANFNGRARRKEYWMFALFNIIFSYGLGILSGILVGVTEIVAFAFLSTIYTLGILIPSLAVGVRRMHDVGKSGWYILIPIYNFILSLTDGENGANQYGPDPKSENAEEIDEIGKPVTE